MMLVSRTGNLKASAMTMRRIIMKRRVKNTLPVRFVSPRIICPINPASFIIKTMLSSSK